MSIMRCFLYSPPLDLLHRVYDVLCFRVLVSILLLIISPIYLTRQEKLRQSKLDLPPLLA